MDMRPLGANRGVREGSAGVIAIVPGPIVAEHRQRHSRHSVSRPQTYHEMPALLVKYDTHIRIMLHGMTMRPRMRT